MHILSRDDVELRQYLNLVDTVGFRDFEHMVDRSTYCDAYNRPMIERNQIFMIRSATASELGRFDRQRASSSDAALATDRLRNFVKNFFPVMIANFRIVHCEEDPARVFIFNMYGEKFLPGKPLDYFRPRSIMTMRRRCLDAGNSAWFGPKKAIEPFINYCLDHSAKG